VNVQINLEKRAPSIGAAAARWITENLHAPLEETVTESLGLMPANVATAIQKRLLVELSTLAPLARAALEAPVETR
jgi:hypothetical protein